LSYCCQVAFQGRSYRCSWFHIVRWSVGGRCVSRGDAVSLS
jgi:hypothetical protein